MTWVVIKEVIYTFYVFFLSPAVWPFKSYNVYNNLMCPASLPQWQDRAKLITKQHCFSLSTENGHLSKSSIFFSFPLSLECIVLSGEWMHCYIIYLLLHTAKGNSIDIPLWCIVFCSFLLCFCSVVYQDGFYGAEIYVSIFPSCCFSPLFSTHGVREGGKIATWSQCQGYCW